MFRPDEYVKQVLLKPTDRDKQRTVGASNMSTACTRCLADDMLNTPRPQGIYNMGAVVGTAIHAYLEDYNTDPDAQMEMRVHLGDIPGYGEIKSTTDLYLPNEKAVLDFKTTTRDKMARYQKVAEHEPDEMSPDSHKAARSTMDQYFRQAQLYAWGVEQKGLPVSKVGIIFVCRDGQVVDRDIWSPPMREYRREIAEAVFNRTVNLWDYLKGGGEVDKLTQDEYCYFCNAVRPYMIEEVTL